MRSFARASFFLCVSSCVFLFASPSRAATSTTTPVYDVAISSGDITYTPARPTIGKSIRIYAAVKNNGTDDVEGLVRFFDGDTFIGGKLFSVRAQNRPEDTWIVWKPTTTGTHALHVEAVNDTPYRDQTPSDNRATISIFVEPDADGDGIPDSDDPDADNDGLTNTQEASKKTDPLNPDTDGDHVPDATDAFPLDPKRSVAPPKPKPKPIAPPQTKPSIKADSPALKSLPPLVSSSTEPVIVLEEATSSEPLPTVSSSTIPVAPTPPLPPPTPKQSLIPEKTPEETHVIQILIGLGILTALIGGGALMRDALSRREDR